MKMSMERWWNYIDKGKLVLGKNLYQCNFINHKSHMNWSGIEPGSLWCEAGYYPPERALYLKWLCSSGGAVGVLYYKDQLGEPVCGIHTLCGQNVEFLLLVQVLQSVDNDVSSRTFACCRVPLLLPVLTVTDMLCALVTVSAESH
jgi:hypothetical protein